MTPRSVQIWFQNRRQRLLKPLRQGEHDAEDESSPREVYASLSPGEEPNDDYAGGSTSPGSSSSGSTLDRRPGQQHACPMAARLAAAQALAPLMRGDGGSCFGGSSLPAPMGRLGSGMVLGDARAAPYPLSLLPQAVAAGHVSPSAAALLVQALQQQLGGRPLAPACMGDDASRHTAPAAAPAPPASSPKMQPPESVYAPAAAPAASQPSSFQKAPSEGVDGLLLLSACADVQRQGELPCYPSPAPPSCCSHPIMA